MTDFELLDAWRAGDVRAGQRLVKTHYDSVYYFFFGKVDASTSEDLTQATFETLCRKRAGFRGESSLRTFLFGIARWKLVRHFERRRTSHDPFDPLEHSIHDPDLELSITSLFAARDREVLLVQALRSLPLDDQILLELKDYEGLTARELADTFDIPPGTVASRLNRARERLRSAVTRLSDRPELVEHTLTNLDAQMRVIRDKIVAATPGAAADGSDHSPARAD